MRLSTLCPTGRFYKGNLHLHSTRSDGHYTPEQLFERYKRNGYAFLGISDHRLYAWYPEQETDGFLSVPAAEFDTPCVDSGAGVHHIVAFGDPATTGYGNGQVFDVQAMHTRSAQQLIDDINAHANLAVYCHPDWSRVEFTDLYGLRGLVGMEIFNYDCQNAFRTGNGEVFYGRMLWHDNRLWCFGTDDGHGFFNNEPIEEFCGGYIMVKTDDFTHAGLLSAIRAGSFYACAAREGEEAPTLGDFYVEDGKAVFTCGPCRDACIYYERAVAPRWGHGFRCFRGTADAPVTGGSVELPDDVRFVRVMLEDFKGGNSWSQPLFLQQKPTE